MNNSMMPSLTQARLAMQTERLVKSNDTAERFGLRLSETQIQALIAAEAQTLRTFGRMEFGEGILPRLVNAFCDSPYISRDDYCDTLIALQELFYAFKNDLYDALSDDELIEAMHKIYHGRAQGSLEYLENISTDRLIRVLCSENTDWEEYDE